MYKVADEKNMQQTATTDNFSLKIEHSIRMKKKTLTQLAMTSYHNYSGINTTYFTNTSVGNTQVYRIQYDCKIYNVCLKLVRANFVYHVYHEYFAGDLNEKKTKKYKINEKSCFRQMHNKDKTFSQL